MIGYQSDGLPQCSVGSRVGRHDVQALMGLTAKNIHSQHYPVSSAPKFTSEMNKLKNNLSGKHDSPPNAPGKFSWRFEKPAKMAVRAWPPGIGERFQAIFPPLSLCVERCTPI